MPPKIPPALAFLSEDQCWECEQSYGDFDQDTPTGAEPQTIAWQHTKVDADGNEVREGHECRLCYGVRRKERAGMSLVDVAVQIHTDESEKAKWHTLRQKRMAGEGRYLRKPLNKKVQSTRGTVDNALKTGWFIEVFDYLRKVAPDKRFDSRKLACKYVKEVLHATVVRSKLDGCTLVEVFEQDATSYRIERGVEDKVQEVSWEELPNDEGDCVNEEIARLVQKHVERMELSKPTPFDVGPSALASRRLRLTGKTRVAGHSGQIEQITSSSVSPDAAREQLLSHTSLFMETFGTLSTERTDQLDQLIEWQNNVRVNVFVEIKKFTAALETAVEAVIIPFDDPGFQNVIEYARKMWTALSQIFIPYNLHALDCLGEKPRFLERLVYGYVASDSAGDTVMVSQQSEGPPAWERTWQDVQILAWVAYAIRLLQHALVPGCKNNEFASGVNRSQSRRCKSGKP